MGLECRRVLFRSVKIGSAAVGCQGGGDRPDMAQAGGPDGDKIAEAIAEIKKAI